MRIFNVLAFCILLASCQEKVKNLEVMERFAYLEEYEAIKEECRKFGKELQGQQDDIIKIGNDTSIAPLYFHITLYPGIRISDLKNIEKIYNIEIPLEYQNFLTQINGGYIYQLSLYGFPLKWINEGLINRKELEALNLYTANNSWKGEMNVDQSLFLFGGSPYSETSNLYYFLDKGKVIAYLDNGEKVMEWVSINEMLESEINRLKENSF